MNKEDLRSIIAKSIVKFITDAGFNCFISGSVRTGLLKTKSDIDIYVFCDDYETVYLFNLLYCHGFVLNKSHTDYEGITHLLEMGDMVDILVQTDHDRFIKDKKLHDIIEKIFSGMSREEIDLYHIVKGELKGSKMFGFIKFIIESFQKNAVV